MPSKSLNQLYIIMIPKSVHIERMKQNIDVFDFKLNEDEMNAIKTLDRKQTMFFDHDNPE